MTKAKSVEENGHSEMQRALTTLIQNQAILVQTQAAFAGELRETEKGRAKAERESQERFARIEAQMAEIMRVLNEHSSILEGLPDAVRDKIGFKP